VIHSIDTSAADEIAEWAKFLPGTVYFLRINPYGSEERLNRLQLPESWQSAVPLPRRVEILAGGEEETWTCAGIDDRRGGGTCREKEARGARLIPIKPAGGGWHLHGPQTKYGHHWRRQVGRNWMLATDPILFTCYRDLIERTRTT
jgi:hypothetical protein